ncbi:Protein of unknown function [Bacillus thuringiensis]|uniref:Uncharacterized protein n=1 Tax=Bacillus thuringiensis TaxID=1428 RepID=A0A1C4E4Q6_BACTU|nr:Protein of unknown function [Bacillus thuringiensis]
MVPKEVMEEY